jgi:hypothetical protein
LIDAREFVAAVALLIGFRTETARNGGNSADGHHGGGESPESLGSAHAGPRHSTAGRRMKVASIVVFRTMPTDPSRNRFGAPRIVAAKVEIEIQV